MKKLLSQSIKTLFLALLFGAVTVFAQWTPPSGTPTSMNAPTPINTSAENQSKAGKLMIPGIQTGGLYVGPTGFTGIPIGGSAHIEGGVSIGNAVTIPPSGNLSVKKSIGAGTVNMANSPSGSVGASGIIAAGGDIFTVLGNIYSGAGAYIGSYLPTGTTGGVAAERFCLPGTNGSNCISGSWPTGGTGSPLTLDTTPTSLTVNNANKLTIHKNGIFNLIDNGGGHATLEAPVGNNWGDLLVWTKVGVPYLWQPTSTLTVRNGNVGINNLVPNAKLDIVGNTNVSGNTNVVGNSTITGNLTLSALTGTANPVLCHDAIGKVVVCTVGNSGGLLMPPGTLDQTLRHNGTNWIATSGFKNDGTNITIASLASADKVICTNSSGRLIICPSQPGTGGTPFPLGTSGQTIRYNASNTPVANDTLKNDGQKVSVGTSGMPDAWDRLHVYNGGLHIDKSGTDALFINNTNAGNTKVAIISNKPTFHFWDSGNNTNASILVKDVTASSLSSSANGGATYPANVCAESSGKLVICAAPPPPNTTCTDANAFNNGSSLPCTYVIAYSLSGNTQQGLRIKSGGTSAAPSNTTFTVPAGITQIMVDAYGGGGGGTNSYGGGGAGYSRAYINVTPGQQFVVDVGSGGTNGACGTDGQNSTVIGNNYSIIAGGGKKGCTSNGAGGVGQTGTSSTNLSGQSGSTTYRYGADISSLTNFPSGSVASWLQSEHGNGLGPVGGKGTNLAWSGRVRIVWKDPSMNMSPVLAGVSSGSEPFSSTDTWIAPAGVTSVTVELWGGGGGGGGSKGLPGGTTNATNGQAGAASKFDYSGTVYMQANGGIGGLAANNGVGAGGVGGTATGGCITNNTGSAGQAGDGSAPWSGGSGGNPSPLNGAHGKGGNGGFGGGYGAAGGGGGGGYAKCSVSVTPGLQYNVTIGTGGPGGTASNEPGYPGQTGYAILTW